MQGRGRKYNVLTSEREPSQSQLLQQDAIIGSKTTAAVESVLDATAVENATLLLLLTLEPGQRQIRFRASPAARALDYTPCPILSRPLCTRPFLGEDAVGMPAGFVRFAYIPSLIF